MALVAGIDCEFRGLFRNRDAVLDQGETAILTHQEGRHALADGQQKRRLRPIDEKAGRKLLASAKKPAAARRQDREDGADGHVHADIGRPVERVAGDNHAAIRRQRDRVVALLRHVGRRPGLARRLENDLVGQNIQRLLDVAIGIHLAGSGIKNLPRRPDLGADPNRRRRAR